MSLIKIKNVDVLCGKGKKINDTPGNIRFRKVVDQYRTEYSKAEKKQKINIASKVIKDIHRSGGRFLCLNPRTKKWEEITIRRATEKACQALRELGTKAKANGTVSSTSKRKRHEGRSSTARKKPSPTQKPPANRARTSSAKTQTNNNSSQKQTTKSTEEENDKSKQSTTTMTAKLKAKTKGQASTTSGEPDNDSKDPKKQQTSKKTGPRGPLKEIDYSASHDKIELAELAKQGGYDNTDEDSINGEHVFEDDPNAQPYHWHGPNTTGVEWDTMHQQMKRFRNVFGHAAIPPNWAGDLELANWASRQRQLNREVIKTSHRVPSVFELDCIEKLNEIDFVWDYDDWRWNQCFNDATRQMNSGLDKGVGVGLTESLKVWIEEQTKLATMGKLPLEKAKKLQSLSQRLGRFAKLDRAKTHMEPGGEGLLLI